MKRKILLYTGLLLTLSTASAFAYSQIVTGFSARDPYPLHSTLKYSFETTYNSHYDLLTKIVKYLDIENNARYMRTGVYYKDGKAYEIPLQEVADFGIKTSHNNTYCNIFVNDVLNILANSSGEEKLRLTKNSVGANVYRNLLAQSPNWKEVNIEEGIRDVQQGGIVIMSYTEKPNGHVAFLRQESTPTDIRLWNVGSVNEENHRWKNRDNVKYFRWVK